MTDGLTQQQHTVLHRLEAQLHPIRLYAADRRTGWQLVDAGLAQTITLEHHDCFSITDAGRREVINRVPSIRNPSRRAPT